VAIPNERRSAAVAESLDQLARVAGDLANLVPGLLDRRGRVDAEDSSGTTLAPLLQGREAGDLWSSG